jgi:macrolide transport system ATP-binding/permease protein
MRLERWVYTIPLRFRSLFRRSKADQELDDELRDHVEQKTQEYVAKGLSAAEACRQALLELRGLERTKEDCRDARGVTWLHDLAQDLRYGFRILRKSPGFTTVAVLTLALGIGANTAIFTILNAAALRPIPVPNANKLVSISQNVRRANGPISRNVHDDAGFVSYSEYRLYARDNRAFSGLLAYSPFTETTLGTDKPQAVLGTLASCNYFDVLEIHPALGRFFTDADCSAPGESPSVVLSDSFWQRTLGGKRTIVGKTIVLNRTAFRVIGIAPPGFDGTLAVASSFWAPLTMQKAFNPDYDRLSDDNLSWLGMIGRLRSDISLKRAAADLSIVASRLNSRQPGRITTVMLEPATLLAMHSLRTPMLSIGALIMAAVGLVLLLACANIANLLLARAAGRRKEIAVRLASGATRGRLIRQLLAESLVLALIGGSTGALASWFSVAAIFRTAMLHLSIGREFVFSLNLSPGVLTWLFAFALSVATACCFGLAPALRASNADLTLAMKEEGAHSQSGSMNAGRLRNVFIGVQVAVCMLLLLVSGLFLRGLHRAETVNPGFRTQNIETVEFDLPIAGYTAERAAAFQRQLRERLAALPGIEAVAQASVIPLAHNYDVTGFSTPDGRTNYEVQYNCVSPEFFSLLGIQILAGRDFTEAETRTEAHVLILTRSTALRIWPNENSAGQLLEERFPKALRRAGIEWQVIGVAADAQVADLGESDTLYAYRPAGPEEQAQLNFLLRGKGWSADASKRIEAIVKDLDPTLPVTVAPLSQNLESWRAVSRVVSTVSVILGALALFLASIGIYGVVSYSVSRRVREIGIRMALGADNRTIMRLVLRQGMFPVTIGITVGAGLCACVSRILSQVLYGISPWDPLTFASTPLFLCAVALLAGYLPARRAMRVDPMVALRYE